MRAPLALATLFALALVPGPGNAGHCTTWSTSDPEIDTGATTVGRHYVDLDMSQTDRGFAIWYYEEVNGIDGLQRGDEWVDDTCHNMIDADVIIF